MKHIDFQVTKSQCNIFISQIKKDERNIEALLLSVSLNMKNKTQTKKQKLIASFFLLMGPGCLGAMQTTTFHFFSVD